MEYGAKELWLDLGRGFLYVRTEENTIEKAVKKFLGMLESNGVITDNFGYEATELRLWGGNGGYTVLEEDRR